MSTPHPLLPDDVDLLLSAELDGDFDAAADDLGLHPDEARARLAVTEGVEARRVAFAAAHEISRTPEPLPPTVRERIVAMTHEQPAPVAADDDLTARRAARADRSSVWNRRLIGAGAVAAALALVVGLFASVAGDGDGDDADTAGDAATAEGSSELRSYGDVSDEDRLRALLDSDDATGDAQERYAGSDSTDGRELTPGAPTEEPRAADFTLRSQVIDCVTTLANELADGSAALEQGTASYSGVPAGLVVFNLDGRRFAVVFDPGTCEPRKTVLGPP